MNSEEGLVQGFYCVTEAREVFSGPHQNRQKAREAGEQSNAPYAILEVIAEFNNFAWGE